MMEVFLILCTVLGGIAAVGWIIQVTIASLRRDVSSDTQPASPGNRAKVVQVSGKTEFASLQGAKAVEDVLIPSRINNMIYEGHAGIWDDIIHAYQDAKHAEHLSPRERITLAASYNIARFWRLAYSDHHIIFFDSSWLLHGCSFWITDPEMHRWLSAQGKVAERRARNGRRTTRVFYWRPDALDSNVALMLVATTIMEHLSHGIDVYLVTPEHWPEVLDFALHSKRHGLFSSDFSEFRIDQLKGASEMELGFTRFEDVLRLAATDALHFPLGSCREDVIKKLVQACPSLPDIDPYERKSYRDRSDPHRPPLPHHAAYGSVLRDSADQAKSDPGEHKPK